MKNGQYYYNWNFSLLLIWLSVVFSYWTYTLDLIEKMLDHHSISYTRIDGKMPLIRRTASVEAFQNNDTTRIILVSIMCGGAGWVSTFLGIQKAGNCWQIHDSLDLTAGSRAYIIEPHWNPMVEEQALCRIHRVGQSRNVTTVRYVMKDSFEEVCDFDWYCKLARFHRLIFCTASHWNPETQEDASRTYIFSRRFREYFWHRYLTGTYNRNLLIL